MFSLKTYETEEGKLVAACDRSILGETFKEGKIKLEIKEDFFHDEKVKFEKISNELVDAKSANLVGENIIQKLLEEEFINEEEIKRVDNVPHVQIFVLEK